MAEENTPPPGEGTPAGTPPPENDLSSRYKEKGFQKMSMEEYEAQRAKQSKKRKVRVPTPVKFVGKTLFFVIFCFGIIFVPWVLWIVGTNPIEEKKPPKTPTENSGEQTTSSSHDAE